MTTPKVVPIPHLGPSPYAPRALEMTPAQAKALQRATPLMPSQLRSS